MTGKCYITDCAPGKGHDFHAKTGGSCTSCVAGTSWNALTDDEPCADVLASCPTGQGYSRSTTKVADSSCHSCAAGTWSGANDDNACAAHAMTTCPAGEELDMGSAHKDATCAACAAGYWKGGSGTMACEPHSLVVSCPAGQETGLPSSATSDTACIACGAGKYSTGSMTACAEHGSIACGVGSEPGAGTSTAAAICEACPSGKFSASDSTMKCDAHTDISTCAAGSAGKLGTSAEDSSCTPCPEGGKKATVGEGKCMTSGCSADKMDAPEVAVFNYPGLNGRGIGDSSDENSNLLSAIQNQNLKHGGKYTINDEITSFALSDLADRFASASFFFMTDMESQNPTSDSFLPASACGIISDWVSAGGVILMTGTYGGHDTNFMNKIFGWDLTTTSAGSWSLNAANAAGTSFEGGPASIGSPSATDSIGLGSVPDTKVIYGSHSDATVAVLPYDKGMVIFLGFDFYAAGFANDWGKGTHSAGHQNSDSWATEILPRALKYATVAFGEACGVDCAGSWAAWSGCSAPCGGGTKTRIFEVSTVPTGGGAACSDPESEACNPHACPTKVPSKHLDVDIFTDGTPPTCPHSGSEKPKTSFKSCPAGVHGGVGVGNAKNCAVAAYAVHVPVGVKEVTVKIQWGHSSWSDKSYMAFDSTPTPSSQMAGDDDSNKLKEYKFGAMEAGEHTFMIGTIDDGNYYTLPWCSIEIDWGVPTAPPPAPPAVALPLGVDLGIDVDVFTAENPASCAHTGTAKPSTSFQSCPAGIHGGVGVGEAKNCAMAGYEVTIPEGAHTVWVTVQYGHSSWADKTYLAWDTAPTQHADHFAHDTDSNNVKTHKFGALSAGKHKLIIGAADDGNYYALPWCSIEVTINPV